MRVLLAHDYAAPVGGAEVAMLRLRADLRALGHDARLFASSARPTDAEPDADYTCFGTTSSFRTALQTANPAALVSLSRVIREFRPDVVHVGMFLTQLSPLVLRALAGVGALYHVHWLRPICPTGVKLLPDVSTCDSDPGLVCLRSGCVPARDWPLLMFQMRVWRRWSGVFDAIVANSEYTRRRLVAAGIAPVDVVYYGIPNVPARPPLGPAPVVAYAGRLSREKGVEVLVRAFAEVAARVPEARLLVVGDGPERLHLERLAGDLGIASRVDLRGQVARDEVEAVMAPAWVQVAPSLGAEAFGLAAAEAMARGTALVVSDIGGLAEVAGDAALRVPPGDSGALAAALITLLSDAREADRLGRLGREAIRGRFAAADSAAGFTAIYERILGDRRNCGER